MTLINAGNYNTEICELKDIPKDETFFKYVILNKCAECGEVLNTSKDMTADEIHKGWASIVMSAPLCTGACPKGCRPTYPDCNANTEFEIHRYVDYVAPAPSN